MQTGRQSFHLFSILLKAALVFFFAFLASCGGGGGGGSSADPVIDASGPQILVADLFTAQVTSAPADGATISGTVTLEVKGNNIANVELLPAEGYLPRYAIFTVSEDKTTATATLDTTKLPDGALVVRISAFDTPAGSATANEIVAMPARTWNIKNNAKPDPGNFTAQLVSAPADGATISGTVTLEVAGNNIQNVELLPTQGYVPILARFTVSSDKTKATLSLDTTQLDDGPMAVRISAFNAPAGSPASEIVVMPGRTWTIKNKATPASFSARLVSAPADGATISGSVRLEIAGSGIKNAELLPPSGYLPIYATFNVSSDGTRATLDLDTTQLQNGRFAVRISAFNVPAKTSGASEIVAMAARTWTIRNKSWSITDLGSIGSGDSTAVAINDAGDIVGHSYLNSSNSVRHAFLYRNGQMIDMGTLSGGTNSNATAINNAGQIVGASSSSVGFEKGFLYSNGVMTALGLPANIISSRPYAINDAGNIVGNYNYSPQSTNYCSSYFCAFLFANGQMTDLGYFNQSAVQFTTAVGISQSGQIVANSGSRWVSSILYSNGVYTMLPSFSRSGATSTTESYFMHGNGQIVGSSTGYAFVYANGVMTNIGKNIVPTDPYAMSYAYGINRNGAIVGHVHSNGTYMPFLYRNGSVTYLNNIQEVSASGWKPETAAAINSSGWIVGTAVNSQGRRHAYLLIPPWAQ